MRSQVRAIIGGIALAAYGMFGAAALAQEAPKHPPIEELGRGNDCTWARTIRNWEAVDRNHIIIKGTGRERFLVRFSGACSVNPRFEMEIGVVSRDSRLCPYGGDQLIIGGERCPILNIWQLPEE